MADTQVGFVGIGNMGAPMVKCLLKAGFKVTAFDANPAALKQFADTPGVQIAAGLKSLARTCPVVITMLPDSKIVRRVVLGGGDAPSLADGLQRDSIVIDMSSSFAPDTVKLGADLAARSVGLVDAPVSGGVGKAVTGTLAIMTGTSGWYLALAMGYLATPYPGYWWALAALGVIVVLTVLGLGVLLPTQIRVYLELCKPEPDRARIAKLSGSYFYIIAVQGLMQVAMIAIMTRFRMGL